MQRTTTKHSPLARRFRLGSLLRFAAPSIGMMIIISLYTVTDGIFIGRYAGSDALAAHQIAIMSVYVAFMVPVGISYATTFRIGQHYGAGRLADARRAGRLGIGGGACCMLVFALLFWLAPEWVVGLFLDHQDPQFASVVALAVSLLAVAAWFELFDGIQTIAMGAIRGLKDGKTTLLVGILCYWVIGIPLAWALAFPLGWGAEGVWWGLAGGLACAALLHKIEDHRHQYDDGNDRRTGGLTNDSRNDAGYK